MPRRPSESDSSSASPRPLLSIRPSMRPSRRCCRAGLRPLRVQKAICNDWDTIPVDASISRSIDAFAGMFEGEEPSRMMGAFLNRKRG